jgi:hypothetical protein
MVAYFADISGTVDHNCLKLSFHNVISSPFYFTIGRIQSKIIKEKAEDKMLKILLRMLTLHHSTAIKGLGVAMNLFGCLNFLPFSPEKKYMINCNHGNNYN